MHRRDLFKKIMAVGAGVALAKFGVEEVAAAEPPMQHARAIGMKNGTPIKQLFPQEGKTPAANISNQTLTTSENIVSGTFTISNGTFTSLPISYGSLNSAQIDFNGQKHFANIDMAGNNIGNVSAISVGDTIIRSAEDGGIEFVQNDKIVLKINNNDKEMIMPYTEPNYQSYLDYVRETGNLSPYDSSYHY